MATKRKRTDYVTRRVMSTKTVVVYKLAGTNLEKLDTIEVDGKINEGELAKKYNVKKVVTVVTEQKQKIYGVPIEKFMEIAELLKEKTLAEKDEQEKMKSKEKERK